MFSIVVQAGGESRRMGGNKALLEINGVPLITRVLQRVSGLADEILITTNQPQDLCFLPYPLVPDVLPGRGALGGLYTAIYAASHDYVGVVACDMPFVNARLLSYEFDLLKNGIIDVVIPKLEMGYEPFHAVYRKETCLPMIKKALEEGQKRMVSWLPWVNILELNREMITPIASPEYSFININTPEDLKRVKDWDERPDDI